MLQNASYDWLKVLNSCADHAIKDLAAAQWANLCSNILQIFLVGKDNLERHKDIAITHCAVCLWNTEGLNRIAEF